MTEALGPQGFHILYATVGHQCHGIYASPMTILWTPNSYIHRRAKKTQTNQNIERLQHTVRSKEPLVHGHVLKGVHESFGVCEPLLGDTLFSVRDGVLLELGMQSEEGIEAITTHMQMCG